MKAGRLYGPGDLRVDDIPEPVPKEGQVKVKIACNGICGSDLHAYTVEIEAYANQSKPHEVTGETAPITIGHEFSGTIVELGPGVNADKWPVGTNVVIEPLLSCRRSDCTFCNAGTRNLCPLVGFIGCAGLGGGLAEYITVDEHFLHVLPQGIPLEVGACVEPLSIAYHAVKRSGFVKGQSVLIVGAGPIGLFVLKVIRSIDPTTPVFVSEPAEIRRAFAIQHGATKALNPLKENVLLAVRSAVPDGVDVAFEAAGIQQALDAALFSLRPKGTLVNVAIWEKDVTLNMNYVLWREVSITGVIGYDRVHEEVLQAMAAGKFKDIEKLITKRISLDQVVEEGFQSLLKEKDKHVKVLVFPSSSDAKL